MSDERLTSYRLRNRAEVFGTVADAYDRYRPEYPDALIDDLVALRPRRVLDIGAGTGKATRQLVAHGLDVLAVEFDPKMAEVARRSGLTVEVSGFEKWDDAGRRFDLVTCAQAWHWIDPDAGAAKIADILEPGGTFAAFWNHDELVPEVMDTVTEVYRRRAPELLDSIVVGGGRHRDRPYLSQLTETGRFAQLSTRDYDRETVYARADWLGMVATHSDHLQLSPDDLQILLDELSAALPDTVTVHVDTSVILARTAT